MKHWIVFLIFAFYTAIAAQPEEILRPVAPGGAFLTGEELRFDATVPENFKWELLAFPELRSIRTGTAEGDAPLILAPLPNGYYILRITAGDIRFAVLPDPEKSRTTAESFFALDAPLAVLVKPADAEKAVEIARRSGVKFIRERSPSWAATEKERGKVDFGRFDRNATLFAKSDIQVLSMYHNSPDWSRPLRPDNRMPDDLMALYKYSRMAAAFFKGRFPAFEYWNESDYSGVDSVWDYAACLKAASLGYRAGNPDAKILNGGFAIEAGDLPYHHVLMKNGAGYYFDILSLHSYGAISRYPLFLKKAFHFLEQYGCGDKPVWYTETGCRAEGRGAAPFNRHLKEHTLDQELIVAEFLVKQMISAQFCGAEHNFFFSLYPCNEEGGAKVWGLTRRDTLAVKAGFVAFATLISELGNAELEGELKDLPPKFTGYAYRQPDGSRTLVVWRLSENDRRVHEEGLKFDGDAGEPFPLSGNEICSAVNLFGTPIPSQKLVVGRLPVYIRNAPAMAVTSPERRNGMRIPLPEVDRTIVFQLILPPEVGIVAEEGPWKSKPRQRADFKREYCDAKLRIYNFSDQAKQGSFEVAGAEWHTAGSAKTFRIGPMDKCEFDLRLSPSETRGDIIITGRFDGRDCTPLLMPFRTKKAGESVPEPLLLSNSRRWRAISAGKLKIVPCPEENSLEFQTLFDDTVADCWSYPRYSLEKEKSLEQAAEIAFELALDSERDNVKRMLLLAHFKLGGKQDFQIPLPEEIGVFTEVRIPLDKLRTPEHVTAISLGGNLTSGRRLAYRVRNLRIIYR